ncbi:MAG: hypothetical protein GX236_04920 [Clostridiaceae bacterium]|jgi:hypothetical protein|nr:hypothetical protein [Clostridiaceae bacterium]
MKTVTLRKFEELAINAHRWISFDSKKRAETIILEHERLLQSDLEFIPEEERNLYIKTFENYFTNWLYALEKCSSSAVTGRSRFNVQKSQKTNNAEERRYNEFQSWRKKTLKALETKEKTNQPAKKSEEKVFDGGKIIYNYNLNRLQILFNQKPDSEIIENLKKHGFRWSPKNRVWQRQLTENAIKAAGSIVESHK